MSIGQTPGAFVRIEYINHRSERSSRVIEPLNLYYGSTEWHPEPQWLLKAYDEGKQDWRDFAMSQILSWVPLPSFPQERPTGQKG